MGLGGGDVVFVLVALPVVADADAGGVWFFKEVIEALRCLICLPAGIGGCHDIGAAVAALPDLFGLPYG